MAYPQQGVAAIKRGDEEKRLRSYDSPRLRAPWIQSLPPRGGCGNEPIGRHNLFSKISWVHLPEPLLGVRSLTIGYEGNRQLAALVGSSPRFITGTPFRGTFFSTLQHQSEHHCPWKGEAPPPTGGRGIRARG
jgi:hypothetical protein